MHISKIYKDKDACLKYIQSKKVGIIGFGNQGKAQALNLRDSGVNVHIGGRRKGESLNKAQALGFEVGTISDTVQSSDFIVLLIPDQIMSKVFESDILPYLRQGQSLCFSHGYNIHYKLISPPDDVNVIMAAPSGAGIELRRNYEKKSGIPGLFAIHQDFSKDSKELALSYCKGIGLTKIGAFESTFKEETETDLFGEQVVLTGSIPKLLQSSFKVLLDSGYSPLASWFVCYYELKTIVDMFHSKGFTFMNQAISDTAEYGGMTRGKRIVNDNVENEMRNILKEIQSGDFHKEWMKESSENFPVLSKLRNEEKNIPIEKIGKLILKELYGDVED